LVVERSFATDKAQRVESADVNEQPDQPDQAKFRQLGQESHDKLSQGGQGVHDAQFNGRRWSILTNFIRDRPVTFTRTS